MRNIIFVDHFNILADDKHSYLSAGDWG